MSSNNVIADQLDELSLLYELRYLLGRLQKNVSMLQSGSSNRTITVINGDLFKIAAQEYGDAMLWSAIAQANNLFDPIVPGPITLTLPNNPRETGGLLAQ